MVEEEDDEDDYDEDYYEYRDLVGEGAIDVRINGGEGDSDPLPREAGLPNCSGRRQVRRCQAKKRNNDDDGGQGEDGQDTVRKSL